MRLFTFDIVLIYLGKVCIQLFSLQLWVNCEVDLVFDLLIATATGEEKC